MIETGKLLQQRYRIDRQIGQGGMGAVYVATDERFGSTVAIKETLCMDDNYRKAIEREARLLNSLKHVALPRVTDHFLEENGQFLVMEYISGDDLAQTLETTSQPFPVKQVLTWADQLLEALDFLHGQVNPVIHRDIKPQNLKVTPKGQIVLLDFGLAKGNVTDAGHQTAAKSIFGYSRNYASLEQIQGTGTDPRSDLYSLAATLYHLLTNRPPEDALTRAMAVLSHQPDPLVPANHLVPDVPAGVASVLHSALSLNAAQRPATASEMQAMLRDHEQYAQFLPITPAAAATDPSAIYTQQTRIMPGSTVHDGPRQTEVKTQVLPPQYSQVTSVRVVPEQTESPKKRRMGLAAYAIIALLLAGTAIGGAYITNPEIFDRHRDEAQAEAAPVPAPAQPETANVAVPANTEPPAPLANASNVSAVASGPPQPQPPARSGDSPRASARTQASANSASNVTVQQFGNVRVEGNTVYVGNMKIVDGRLETPVRRYEGPRPEIRVPQTPQIPPSAFQNMSPEQRRRVIRSLRRNGISVPEPRPEPTPDQ